MIKLEMGKDAYVTYNNHRGEIATRHIKPLCLKYGTTPYHKEPQWLLDAYDHDKFALRTFALSDMIPE